MEFVYPVKYDENEEPVLEDKEFEVTLKVTGYFSWKGLAKRRDDAINFAYDKWYKADFGELKDIDASVKCVKGE